MATFSEALKDLINSYSGITALIGALPTMRYYPLRLPQPPITYPAITYQIISNDLGYSHSGFSGLTDVRVQLTIWSQTFKSGEAIEIAFKQKPSDSPAGPNGFRGTQSGVQFDRIFLIPGITDFEPSTQIHQRTLDLMIGYVG